MADVRVPGQVDFAMSKEARQDVPAAGPDNKFNFGLSLERDNPPDGGVDNCSPLNFGSVAPDTDAGVSHDLDGESAPGASSFALGSVPE